MLVSGPKHPDTSVPNGFVPVPRSGRDPQSKPQRHAIFGQRATQRNGPVEQAACIDDSLPFRECQPSGDGLARHLNRVQPRTEHSIAKILYAAEPKHRPGCLRKPVGTIAT